MKPSFQILYFQLSHQSFYTFLGNMEVEKSVVAGRTGEACSELIDLFKLFKGNITVRKAGVAGRTGEAGMV